jgi:hypothetical protein
VADEVLTDLNAQFAGIDGVYPRERRARRSEAARVPLGELLGLVAGGKERSSVSARKTVEHANPGPGQLLGQRLSTPGPISARQPLAVKRGRLMNS